MRSLQVLLTQWKTENVVPLPPVNPTLVNETFARLSAAAAEDLAYLYSQMGGMEFMTDAYWRHWPMTEILAMNNQPSEFGVLFADYFACAWIYRVKAVSASKSAVYVDHFDGKAPTLVAACLEEFFDDYLSSNGKSLHQH
jgi:hypothetical protein